MIIPISSLEDERLSAYRNLPNANLTALSRRFVVEGKLLVERLLASSYPTESIVIDERRMSLLPAGIADEVPVYVLPSGSLEDLIGFNFHRGVLACGRRSRESIEGFSFASEAAATTVVCIDIQDPTNLGGILRNCAAFGANTVLLSRHCADPFSRRVLRVSMGAVLKLDLHQMADLSAELMTLRDRHSFELVATVLDATAETLSAARRAPKSALLFGNEGHGLSDFWISMCQRRVTLPMENGTDSLNAAAASAVFLYHFTRVKVV